jgi:hypothetical protein
MHEGPSCKCTTSLLPEPHLPGAHTHACTQAGLSLLINKTYIVIKHLGTGTHGQVKLAFNLKDRKLYAIKMCRKSQLGCPSFKGLRKQQLQGGASGGQRCAGVQRSFLTTRSAAQPLPAYWGGFRGGTLVARGAGFEGTWAAATPLACMHAACPPTAEVLASVRRPCMQIRSFHEAEQPRGLQRTDAQAPKAKRNRALPPPDVGTSPSCPFPGACMRACACV